MASPTDIQPIAALLNPSSLPQAVHMLLAAYAATGFAVAGIHAFALLGDRSNPFHRRALELALIVGGIGAVLQPVSGDFLGKSVTINAAILPSAKVGVAYSQQLTATGGTGTYIWSVVSGSLPPGLTLSNSGLLSGTATGGVNNSPASFNVQ